MTQALLWIIGFKVEIVLEKVRSFKAVQVDRCHKIYLFQISDIKRYILRF